MGGSSLRRRLLSSLANTARNCRLPRRRGRSRSLLGLRPWPGPLRPRVVTSAIEIKPRHLRHRLLLHLITISLTLWFVVVDLYVGGATPMEPRRR